MRDICQHTPSDDLFKAVRACLILRGLSLSSYCAGRGLTRQNVTSALKGEWRGPKASVLVRDILKDCGIAQ
jgi:hypothetical protein